MTSTADREAEVASQPPTGSTIGSERMSVHFSSRSPDWGTPKDLLPAILEAAGGEIDLDPACNLGDPNVPAKAYYTAVDDGLSHPWHGRVYLNPPYGREVGKWVRKVNSEVEAGRVKLALVLVANRPGTRWYRDLEKFACGKCEIRGRLTFIDGRTGHPASNSAPFPSVVFLLVLDYTRDIHDPFVRAFEKHGSVTMRPLQSETEAMSGLTGGRHEGDLMDVRLATGRVPRACPYNGRCMKDSGFCGDLEFRGGFRCLLDDDPPPSTVETEASE